MKTSPAGLALGWLVATLVLLMVLPVVPMAAQEAPPDPPAEEPGSKEPAPEELELFTDVIEVGSRSSQRSRTDTPVPVDVLAIEELAVDSGQVDLGQLLQFVAPSFNSNRQSGSDGSDHIDAATLRGLGPDQVLVRVNGKRRHTSSLVYLFGSRARGNVGTDLNSIPVAAIERIEILRDGAAAQYGSDAIAGVINIVLRKDHGLHLTATSGAYTAGDGGNGQLALNYGTPIGEGGTLNLTAEGSARGRTNRSGPGEPRTIGDAKTENGTLFFNLDLPTGDHGSFYGHGGYNTRDGLAGAWYRGGVGSDDIPSRNSAQMYPDGFVPDIGMGIEDLSAAFGYRTLLGPWSLDVSSGYGSNRMEYRISNTLNASIATGNAGISPRDFDAGGFEFDQQTTNLDLSRYLTGWREGVGIATGLEYRREGYRIFAGEAGSYADFDGAGGGNAGSQGFPGFQPLDEVDASRDSIAAYLDVEVQATKQLLLTFAVRGEHYNDFGDTVNGKVSFGYRYDQVHFRGSASTGFRAPSLHQRYFSSTFTDFIAGVAADVRLAPNESVLARLVGIPELKEETSTNFSLGLTVSPRSDLEVTVDVYQIDIDDRIVLTGGFTSDDPDIGPILIAQELAEARFFTNAIDTRTQGVDLTVAHRRPMLGGNLTTSLALNYNQTEVQRINTAPSLAGKEDIYFNQRERLFVEGSAPELKSVLGAGLRRGDWRGGLALAYFGEVVAGTWSQVDDPAAPPQIYKPRLTTDLHVGYDVTPAITFTVGVVNLFDVVPTYQDPDETENGARWENVQMGFNGTAYFARFGYRLRGS